jgi:cbb3-type cytochrome oxidase maturation protein
MNVLILLLIVSICIAGAFLIAFIWSSEDGQFDDVYSPSRRILFDDTIESENKTNE